jgi:O-methyltransferase involved in polyketide biosynthesis
MYLTREAVISTLKYVATSSAVGSEIVFDYAVPVETLNPLQQVSFHAVAQRVASVGEPWQTFFDPPALLAELQTMGFKFAEDTDPDQINSRFFEDRTDGLRVGGLAHLIKARV